MMGGRSLQRKGAPTVRSVPFKSRVASNDNTPPHQKRLGWILCAGGVILIGLGFLFI